jgi:hypothetical protein
MGRSYSPASVAIAAPMSVRLGLKDHEPSELQCFVSRRRQLLHTACRRAVCGELRGGYRCIHRFAQSHRLAAALQSRSARLPIACQTLTDANCCIAAMSERQARSAQNQDSAALPRSGSNGCMPARQGEAPKQESAAPSAADRRHALGCSGFRRAAVMPAIGMSVMPAAIPPTAYTAQRLAKGKGKVRGRCVFPHTNISFLKSYNLYFYFLSHK